MCASRSDTVPGAEETVPPWGIEVLYEPDVVISRGHTIIDIVAVHGYMGHRLKTWTHERTEKLWLRDFLPKDIPWARIMTYGYDADPRSKTTLAIADVAKNLLRAISAETKEKRRVILIGHSLGGLVLKKAVVLARDELPDLYKSIWGFVFLAVPHGGSALANFAQSLTQVVKPITPLSTALLSELQLDSRTLTDLKSDFAYLQHRFYYISARESNKTKPGFFGRAQLVVDKKSSVLGLPKYEVEFPIMGADHRQVCKFSSQIDPGYRQLSSEIMKMADASIKAKANPDKCRHFMMPNLLSSHFTGRKEELQKISEVFAGENDRSRRVSLWGAGGMGKTQLVFQYASGAREHYTSVFFITATTIAEVSSRYGEIFATLGLPKRATNDATKQATEVKRWLESHSGWLLIFDDVQEHLLVELKRQFLPSKTCHMMITTRSERAAKAFAEERHGDLCLPVEGLPQELAVDLLLAAGQQELQNLEVRRVAAQVSQRLGNVPWALEFVGRGYRSPDVLEEVLHKLDDPQKRAKFMTIHEDSIDGYTKERVTFANLLSFTVEKLDESIGQPLWYVTAFLDPSWISRHLFKKVDDDDNALLCRLATEEDLINNKLRNMYDIGLLLSIKGTGDYWIHDLPHQINQASLTPEQNLQLSEVATRWILHGIPGGYGEFGSWKWGTQQLGHILRCISRLKTLQLVPKKLGVLLYSASRFARFKADYRLAEMLARESLNFFENHPELAEEEDVSQAKDCLGTALRRQSKWDEAEGVFRENLEYQKTKFGDRHAITLGTMNELGWLYHLSGRYSEAEAWLRATAEKRLEVFGPDHGPTQHTWQNLAACLTKRGQLQEAENLYNAALEGHVKKFGEKQFWVLHIKSNIVDLRDAQGNLPGAVQLAEEVLKGRREIFGKTHPDTLRIANTAVKIRIKQNQFDEAERLAFRVYEDCRVELGERENETLDALDWVAQVRKAAGRPTPDPDAEKTDPNSIYHSICQPEGSGSVAVNVEENIKVVPEEPSHNTEKSQRRARSRCLFSCFR